MKYEVKPSGNPNLPFAVCCNGFDKDRPIAQFAKKEAAEWYADTCNKVKK